MRSSPRIGAFLNLFLHSHLSLIITHFFTPWSKIPKQSSIPCFRLLSVSKTGQEAPMTVSHGTSDSNTWLHYALHASPLSHQLSILLLHTLYYQNLSYAVHVSLLPRSWYHTPQITHALSMFVLERWSSSVDERGLSNQPTMKTKPTILAASFCSSSQRLLTKIRRALVQYVLWLLLFERSTLVPQILHISGGQDFVFHMTWGPTSGDNEKLSTHMILHHEVMVSPVWTLPADAKWRI